MDLLLPWMKMQPCPKAMLPERPNSVCHQALLRAQLSHQSLQWWAAMRNQTELVHKPGMWRSVVVFVHLKCKSPGNRKEGRKGMLLPENMPRVHLMHIFELLKRWKQNSLVVGEVILTKLP